MTITLQEVKALVHAHLAKHPEVAAKLEVSMPTVHSATYDEDADGKHVPRIGPDDEAIKHPITRIELKLGRTTQVIPLVEGNGSTHTMTPRSRESLEAIIKQQIGYAIIEATKKPMTLEEYRADQRQRDVEAAERARVRRAAHEAERRASLTQAQREQEDFVATHKEHDYHTTVGTLGDPGAFLRAAASLGAISEEKAAEDHEKLKAWEKRSNDYRNPPSSDEEKP